MAGVGGANWCRLLGVRGNTLPFPWFHALPFRRKSFHITSTKEFEIKVMQSQVPVVVNFHAEWCDPCHILTPKLKNLLDNSDQVHLAIVDVETNADLVHTFEVKAVPAVLAMKDGHVIDKFIGLVDHDAIENLVKKLQMHCDK